MSNFFPIIAFPTSNFLDDDMELHQCQTSLIQLENFKRSTIWARTCALWVYIPPLYHCATFTSSKALSNKNQRKICFVFLHTSAWMLNYGWLRWWRAACYGSTLGSNPDIPQKIINGLHRRRSGRHTLARQKIYKKKIMVNNLSVLN